jgi:hypothetical protein
MTPSINQAGLLRVKRQRKLLKPLPHHCKKPMCIGLALETDHQNSSAESLTGPVTPMLELVGTGDLTAANFHLALA